MVCPKLKKGVCRVKKKKCNKKYIIKMAKYKSCSIYKKGKLAKAKTKSKKRKRK